MLVDDFLFSSSVFGCGKTSFSRDVEREVGATTWRSGLVV